MKFVYFFGCGFADGNASMKAELGGKGANLAEMTSLKLPVPAGITISTKVCLDFLKEESSFSSEVKAEVESALRKTEEAMESK